MFGTESHWRWPSFSDFLRPYLDSPIARRAVSRQRPRTHRVSPFTFRVAEPALPFGRHWSGATPGPSHCQYDVPASVTSAISFGSSPLPVRLTRRDTSRHSEIMSAFRGLRSSERDHGALGRSLMTQSGLTPQAPRPFADPHKCARVRRGKLGYYLVHRLGSGGR
jgi:hypothetical protein